jgi:signal transduction histidine kinase
VAAAAERLGTAELNIRRDLDALVARGIARRVKDGAINVLIRGKGPPFDVREAEEAEEAEAADRKQRAAAPALAQGERAALRRVATLVARATPPEDVFAAVAAEAGRLLDADYATLSRHESDGAIRVVASWSGTGSTVSIGTRINLGGRNVHTEVVRTGRAARLNNYAGVSGAAAGIVSEFGIHAAAAAPVSVQGRLWGVLTVATDGRPLAADTEERLDGFTELTAAAIANAQAREEMSGFADEQAALRRVATLVARAAPPDQVFAAVAEEAGRLLGADHGTMSRYDPDGVATLVGTWNDAGGALPVGTRVNLEEQNVHGQVFRTGRPARFDHYRGATGVAARIAREFDVRATVAVPVSVEGRPWGAMIVASAGEPLPADTEARLAGFAELAGTAIANAEARAELAASRARIVAAADATRRRIERNLHDGAQQRLVSLVLQLRTAQSTAPPEAGELVRRLDQVATGLGEALEELREIALGLHPAVLAEGGLRHALKALASRSAIPVHLDIQVPGRLPGPTETAAYYAVAEALTNVAKHARASAAEVQAEISEGVLRVRIRDDGCGGAGFGRGSGLVGLKDRVEALGGRIRLDSQPGAGTALDISLPLNDPSDDSDPSDPSESGRQAGTADPAQAS